MIERNTVARTLDAGIWVAAFEPETPPAVGKVVRGNLIWDAGADGVLVESTAVDTVVERNIARGAVDDGIDVDAAATTLTRNLLLRNGDFGIEAVPGVWNEPLIAERRAILERCQIRNQPGPYQLQAAIGAVHAEAATAEQTDWSQILAIYDQLLALAPTPVVALNRAVAVAEVEGPPSALAAVDQLELESYHPFHATRADLLWRLGREKEAAIAYERAAELAPTEAEREFLRGSASGQRGRE